MARTVQGNSDAVIAIESLRKPEQKASDNVFPRDGPEGRFDNRSWFQLCVE